MSNKRVSTNEDNKYVSHKIVLLGEMQVGKSSLVMRFVRDQFYDFMTSTIGAAYLEKDLILDGNVKIKLEIWDTAGQEKFASLVSLYYRGAAGAVIVYDITNPESFNKAKQWVTKLRKEAETDAIIALIGNKCDLSEKRQVETKEAEMYAKQNGLIFMETSAKTNKNVNEVFYAIANRLPKKATGDDEEEEEGTIKKLNPPKDTSGGCCG